ncbi:MAG: DUF6502 family protein [Burkholderiaceae bacterium]
MNDKDPSQLGLNQAILRLLRPLCRLLLRHRVSFSAFEELAKQVYVQVAMEETDAAVKATQSRASVVTGLTRKEVQRLLSIPASLHAVTDEKHNRAARVLTGWLRDPDFHDPHGQPKALPLGPGPDSFAALVKRYSGDMPMRAVLDELLATGAVCQQADQSLTLAARGYVPSKDAEQKLAILGSDVADLIATIDHNLQHGAQDPRFQRKVMYSSFPAIHAGEFRKLSASAARRLLEKLDSWLSEHGQTPPPDVPTSEVRLGMGIFYFEEPMAPTSSKKK